MEISKETTVTLSVDDLKSIITEYLKEKKGLDVKSIYFKVGAHEDPSDVFAQFPLSHELDYASCKCY